MSDQPLNLNNDASKMPNQQQEYYIDEEGILHFGSSKPSPAPGSSKPTPPSGSSKPTPPPVNNGKTVPPVKSAPTPPPMTEPSDDCDVPEKKSKKGCVIAGVGCGIAVLIAAIVIAVVAIIIYNNNQPHYNSSDTDTMKVVIPEPEEELAVDSAVVLSINSVRDLPVENYDANYLSNNYNVYVYDAEFMNVDYDNDVLTSAGSILYSDEMRYLKPIIKFNN